MIIKRYIYVIVFGTIFLFFSNIASPVITAVDKDIDDIDDKSGSYSKIGTSDNYTEIFTQIVGHLDYIKAKRTGIFIHFGVEMEAYFWGLTIKGLRFPLESFDQRSPYFVYGFAFGNIEWS